MKCIWQVLAVAIELSANSDKALELIMLNKLLEESLVVTELTKDSASIESHMNIVRVLI